MSQLAILILLSLAEWDFLYHLRAIHCTAVSYIISSDTGMVTGDVSKEK